MLTNQRLPVLTSLKGELKRKGWTYKAISEELKVSVRHISLVLNGKRKSSPLIERLRALPYQQEN
ncbi:MAG: helix-turn-helix transcriptional regulator [Akkermansia sp.]|nr:helix-turn-helix transcriptional regulator [Akkermansia sp.]